MQLPRSILFLPLAALLFLSACAGNTTTQDLYNLKVIRPGMTESQVLAVFQEGPAVTSNRAGFTEWHYCETRDVSIGDSYAAIFFVDGVVVDTNQYVVTNSSGGGIGSCEEFARRGSFKIPPSVTSAVADREWDTEVYNIDMLRVITKTRKTNNLCYRGGVHKITVEGQISPDSSFAMSAILDRLESCTDSTGRKILPITVSLKSGGGLLEDGYLMGRTFRDRNITTAIERGGVCASSCAVAFLGGTQRIVEDEGIVMYHAPYFTGENVYGKRDITCEVGDEALDKLNFYYREMTDTETGDRLFERTMWYCSAEDGWVVKGGAAAELYGIATER